MSGKTTAHGREKKSSWASIGTTCRSQSPVNTHERKKTLCNTTNLLPVNRSSVASVSRGACFLPTLVSTAVRPSLLQGAPQQWRNSANRRSQVQIDSAHYCYRHNTLQKTKQKNTAHEQLHKSCQLQDGSAQISTGGTRVGFRSCDTVGAAQLRFEWGRRTWMRLFPFSSDESADDGGMGSVAPMI